MEFYDVISQRRSIRAYSDQAVEQDKLDRIWEAVRQAPTACNLQPFRFLAIRSPQTKAIVCSCYQQPWLAQAPIVVVALGNSKASWKRFDGRSIHDVDVSIALEHLVLAAAAEGLGTCWVCAYDQKQLHKKLGLPAEWDPVAMTPLGYPAETPGPIDRKSISELVQVI